MSRCPVLRYAGLVAIVLSLAIAAGPAMAQMQPPPSGAPPAAPAEKPRAVEKPTSGMLEGSVKKVDPGANQVQVSSGLFGIIGKTLEVNSDTQIQLEGRQATLADLREGAKVKASYETRDGKNFATRIEVMPAEEKAPAQGRLPAQERTPAQEGQKGGSTKY